VPTTQPASRGDLTDTPRAGASVVRSPWRVVATARSEVAVVALPATVATAVALVLVGLALGGAAASRHDVIGGGTAALVLAAAPALVVLALVSGPLAVIDARTHRLPDALTLPGIALCAAALGVAALVLGDGAAAVRAAVGAAVTAGFYALLARLGGLGRGDVKLAWLVSLPLAWVGWGTLATGVLLAFLLGGLWSVGLLVTRRATRKTAVAFGPAMIAGALLAVLLATAAAPAVTV
jgi:leader peptidase (prepilin peptidase)/N-methyltransferase